MPKRRNPSSLRHRLPLAALAALGLAVSGYLACVQVGWAAAAWDPIFGPASSARVLHSALSRALPVPDAAVGAAGYLVELLLELSGGEDRWRTHPWRVVAFGGVAAAMAFGGVALVVVQAAVVRAGCALCLASAILSVAVAAGAALGGEVRAAFPVAVGAWARRRA